MRVKERDSRVWRMRFLWVSKRSSIVLSCSISLLLFCFYFLSFVIRDDVTKNSL